MHHFGAQGREIELSIVKSLCFAAIFSVLADLMHLWKSCECHVNVGTMGRTLFACSDRNSARESIEFWKQWNVVLQI